eukprot:SAG31_NODE_46577_length_254_cov_0.380645_1_plen_33_part_01
MVVPVVIHICNIKSKLVHKIVHRHERVKNSDQI